MPGSEAMVSAAVVFPIPTPIPAAKETVSDLFQRDSLWLLMMSNSGLAVSFERSSIETSVEYPIGPLGPSAIRKPGTRLGSAASAGGNTRPYTNERPPLCTCPHCQDTPSQNPQL